MNRRRLILSIILFALAAAILVIMNRYTGFLSTQQVPPPSKAVTKPGSYTVELYDSKTGVKRGNLAALSYQPTPDGSIDCQGVTLDLAGTTFGDLKLTCDRALVKLDQVARKVAGTVVLSGNITVDATKDGKTTVSGRFEKVSYDVGAKDVTVEGPFHLRWGDAVDLTGTGLKGNVEESRVRFTIDKDITATVGAQFQPSWALAEGKGDLTITAGGPVDFDLAQSIASFAGGVKVTRGAFELACNELDLGYAPAGDAKAKGPDAWKLQSLKAVGAASLKSPMLSAEGDQLLWDASARQAQVSGRPARLSYGKDTIISPLVKAVLSPKNEVVSVTSSGPGTALISSVKMPVVRGREGSPDQPLEISWKESLEYDSAKGLLSIAGGVNARCGAYHATGEKIDLRFETNPAAASEGGIRRPIVALDAEGNISATDGTASVKAESVSYDSASDKMTFTGNPAAISATEGEFTSRSFTYAVKDRKLSSEDPCKLVMRSARGTDESRDRPGEGVTVTAGRMSADLSGPTMIATGTDGVRVESPEGVLTCDSIEAKGVTLEAKANEPAGAAQSSVVATGRGHVKFTKDEASATGETFTYDQAAGTVSLEGAQGKDAEITIGDTATIWTKAVFIDRTANQVTCDRPKVSLTAQDSVMGFLPGEMTTAKEGATVKIYLNAGGKMRLVKVAADKALLSFDGGVEGIKRGVQSGQDDRLTANTLEFDVKLEKDAGDAKAPLPRKTTITAARASGGVYIRYAAGKSMLEGNGTSFEWDRAAKRGTLSGDPAVVKFGDVPPTRGGKITYDFAGKRVFVKGDRGGSITVKR